MGGVCTLCRRDLDSWSVLVQEDPDLRAQSPDDGSYEWLPMGTNGQRYLLLHVRCWREVFEELQDKSVNVGFMFYMGHTSDLTEVILCLN